MIHERFYDTNIETTSYAVVPLVVIGTLLWFILGLMGFIMSIVCVGQNKDKFLNFLGILLAITFGPFYWFYYFFVRSYCRP